MRPLLLLAGLLSLCACTPAPADVPEEPPAAPVRVEVLKWEPFQPTLALLGVVQPAGFAEVAIPTAGRLDYPGKAVTAPDPAICGGPELLAQR